MQVGTYPDDEAGRAAASSPRRSPSATSSVAGSAGSTPATASSSSAASAGVRAIGPGWSRERASGHAPAPLIRPYVGFRPTTPQNAAGIRIEPPVSLPSVRGSSSAASTTADPPLEPPETRSVAQGLRADPSRSFTDVIPHANSCVCVFPTRTAPAARARRIASASRPECGRRRSASRRRFVRLPSRTGPSQRTESPRAAGRSRLPRPPRRPAPPRAPAPGTGR